jgi:hypothetical protein
MTKQLDLTPIDYLNRNIKDIIKEFPTIADVLNQYNIGCVTCNLGTCLFKDIVEIHNLAPGETATLMAKIARITSPKTEIVMPTIVRKNRPEKVETGYSPPLKKLVDEHRLIKRWVAIIPRVIETRLFVKLCGNRFVMVRTPAASFSSRRPHFSDHRKFV